MRRRPKRKRFTLSHDGFLWWSKAGKWLELPEALEFGGVQSIQGMTPLADRPPALDAAGTGFTLVERKPGRKERAYSLKPA